MARLARLVAVSLRSSAANPATSIWRIKGGCALASMNSALRLRLNIEALFDREVVFEVVMAWPRTGIVFHAMAAPVGSEIILAAHEGPRPGDERGDGRQ